MERSEANSILIALSYLSFRCSYQYKRLLYLRMHCCGLLLIPRKQMRDRPDSGERHVREQSSGGLSIQPLEWFQFLRKCSEQGRLLTCFGIWNMIGSHEQFPLSFRTL